MLTSNSYQYYASLDARQVLAALQSIDKSLANLEKQGSRAMAGIGKESGMMASVMQGATIGVVSSLTTKLIEMGAQGVGAFTNIIKESKKAAVTFDVTKRKFVSIFEGNEDMAVAVMERVTKKATSLGMEINEALSLARAFTPDVKGTDNPLEQLDNLLVGVRALAEEDPAQGIIGARYAIDEAMSGSLRSLRQRFEFTSTEIGILKDAQAELGDVVGTIEGINRVMQRRGVDMDALKGTYTQAMGEMQAATSKMQIQLGRPVSGALTEIMQQLNEIMAENGPELQVAAAQIGRVVGYIVELAGTDFINFIKEIDPIKLQEMGLELWEMVDSARTLGDILGDMELGSALMTGLGWMVDRLNEAMDTAVKLAILGEAQAAKTAAIQKYRTEKGNTQNILGFSFGQVSPEVEAAATAAGEAAFANKFKEGADMLQLHTERVDEARDSLGSLRQELEKDTKAGEDAAESYLRGAGAAATISDEAQKELLAYQEAQTTAVQDYQDKLLSIEKGGIEDREDLMIDAARKREDIERKNLRKLDDLVTQHNDDIIEAMEDLDNDTADLARKQAQERIDVERDAAKERIDIETTYQKRLQDIQKSFARSEQDAIETQDAIAYYEAVKRRAREIEDAKEERTTSIAEAKQTADEKLALLKAEQEDERQELERKNAEALQKLDKQLEDELEKQGLARQRDLEDAAISDQQRLEDLILSEQRQVEAAAEANARKLENLQLSLSEEVTAYMNAEQEKTAIVIEEIDKRAAAYDELQERIRMTEAVNNRTENGGYNTYLPLAPMRRALGGNVSAGLSYMVGENGMEMFTSSVPGRISPNPQVRGMGIAGAGNTTNNTFSPSFALNNPAMLTPEQAIQTRKIAEQMAVQVVSGLLGGV